MWGYHPAAGLPGTTKETMHVKASIKSVGRRQVIFAGVASVAAPGFVFAAARKMQENAHAFKPLEQYTAVRGDKLVVSGRVVDFASRAIAGATVEADGAIQTKSDADGRFMLIVSAPATGARHALDIRVTHPKRDARTAHIDSRALAHRDEHGTRRATLEVALT
jgi:ribosomal protein L10